MGAVQAADKDPNAGRNHLVVQRIDVASGCRVLMGGGIEVVSVVDRDEKAWHESILLSD
jgi:hypothetical protein